jgi:hypothetical protein
MRQMNRYQDRSWKILLKCFGQETQGLKPTQAFAEHVQCGAASEDEVVAELDLRCLPKLTSRVSRHLANPEARGYQGRSPWLVGITSLNV